MLMLMLIAGLSELIVIYLIDYLILYVYLQNILAPELTDLETEDSQLFYQLRYYTDFFPLECSSGI